MTMEMTDKWWGITNNGNLHTMGMTDNMNNIQW